MDRHETRGLVGGVSITASAHVPRWKDSLQCAMALAMPSCFSTSESSRRVDGGDW
jgi:hypothetical protein